MADFTKTFHRAPYSAISPTLPALSRAGSTILITGGASGIGYAIAKAFAIANASTIVIIDLRSSIIDSGIAQLRAEVPDFQGTMHGLVCDISKTDNVSQLWRDLEARNVSLDVLVLNAALNPPLRAILDAGADGIWDTYAINVHGNVHLMEGFVKHLDKSPSKAKKAIAHFKKNGLAHSYPVHGAD